jgi:DNA primase
MDYELGPIIEIVEDHLVGLQPSGRDNVASRCPFPDHNDQGPSFAINIRNGLWMCHGCHRSGNLVKLLRGLGYKKRQIRVLTEPVKAQLDHYERRRARQEKTRFRRGNPLEGGTKLPETLLGVYEWKPLDLTGPGRFDPELLNELGVGYDLTKHRIIFPIRDTLGNLVGLSGRATEDWDHPRYKVYTGGWRRDGHSSVGDFGPEFDEWFREDQKKRPEKKRIEQYTVDSRDHLWNGHRVYERLVKHGKREPLYVVEGFKGCIWLIQHGYLNTVALMGSFVTKPQFDLLCLLAGGPIVLLMDNDPAGCDAAFRIGRWLSSTRKRIEVCSYFPWWAEEPDDLNELGLTKTTESRKVFSQWKHQQERGLGELDGA